MPIISHFRSRANSYELNLKDNYDNIVNNSIQCRDKDPNLNLPNTKSAKLHLKPDLPIPNNTRKQSDNSHYNSCTTNDQSSDNKCNIDPNSTSGNEKYSDKVGYSQSEINSFDRSISLSSTNNKKEKDTKGYQSECSDSSIGSIGENFKRFNLNN